MSRFSKEQVSVEEITEAFVVDIVEIANKSFDSWFNEFVEAANVLGKIDDEFFIELAPFSRDSGPVFPWANRSSVESWLGPLKKKLGVQFGARMSRHKFASDLAAVGGSEHDIMNNGTWTSTAAVKHYVSGNVERQKEMLERRKKII